MKMSDPVAFVAMKFDGDPWNDKRYLIISEVLREAGFEPIRADEIRTSDIAMHEISQKLEDAALIVVDASGASHNVSYELGYCHGLKKDPQSVILLCNSSESLPFNYSHFRRHSYKDLRHLRRLLRHRLGISIPLTDEQYGYALAFLGDSDAMYGADVAESILEAFKRLRFSGRCEYYAGNTLFSVPNQYVVGLGLRSDDRKIRLDGAWWAELRHRVESILSEKNFKTIIDVDCCEFGSLRAFRHDLLDRGVVEFASGLPVRILRPAESDSWFVGAVLEQLDASAPIEAAIDLRSVAK
ncbi:hypothetical protein ABGB07_45125 [Micromonosporaceae bacterium B7E4]